MGSDVENRVGDIDIGNSVLSGSTVLHLFGGQNCHARTL